MKWSAIQVGPLTLLKGHELRVYHAVPSRLPALQKRFETTAVRLFEKRRHPPARLLDGRDRRVEFGPDLYPSMGVAGRAR